MMKTLSCVYSGSKARQTLVLDRELQYLTECLHVALLTFRCIGVSITPMQAKKKHTLFRYEGARLPMECFGKCSLQSPLTHGPGTRASQ